MRKESISKLLKRKAIIEKGQFRCQLFKRIGDFCLAIALADWSFPFLSCADGLYYKNIEVNDDE